MNNTKNSCCTTDRSCLSKLKCTPCMFIMAAVVIVAALKFAGVF